MRTAADVRDSNRQKQGRTGALLIPLAVGGERTVFYMLNGGRAPCASIDPDRFPVMTRMIDPIVGDGGSMLNRSYRIYMMTQYQNALCSA